METLLIIALVIAGLLLIVVTVKFIIVTVRAKKLQAEIESLSQRHAELSATNQRLAKWESVDNAATKAAEMRKQTQEDRDKATAEAKQIVATARQQATASREEATRALDAASSKAVEIVRNAENRATEIAGDAYKAVQNAALYERTAKAMKNIIEGYGDEYLVPPHSVLDDLADDFSHTEAGQRLRQARERSKSMVKNGLAATCDYVESSKRETAIKFVVDAFTGRVDSVLSRTKGDNVGKLEAEIRDAFTMVNYEGKAFRDARVTEEYLSARLDELRWASVAQQIKIEEREEQRRIKERMRDEEKARKEFERAMKEASRDEDLIRKATEKAKSQLEAASAEQKQKYELQLAELGRKLAEAEARSQRALSMAQQTKQGHVYVISNIGSFGENVYKIGLTRRLEPLDRVRELGDSSVPFEFDVHALIFSEDAPALENRLHKHFCLGQMNKVNRRKEFFKVDVAHIRKEIEELGLTANWTMTAAAAEFRETMAIDKKIAADPIARDAWINRQLQLEDADLVVEAFEREEEAA